jgi:hypothetical protein
MSEEDYNDILLSGLSSPIVTILGLTEDNSMKIAKAMVADKNYFVEVVINENPDNEDEDYDLQAHKVMGQNIEHCLNKLICTSLQIGQAGYLVQKLLDGEMNQVPQLIADKFWRYLLLGQNEFYD